MLHSRVKLILEYVKAAERGEVPVCHEALRLAYSLCHRLPVIQADRFKPEFYEVICFNVIVDGLLYFIRWASVNLIFFDTSTQQYCDVNLITYLGMITKGCEEVHQFISRFNMLHEKHAVTRRMRGLFY
jgi:COP9 signalosome complex subunit 6